MTWPEWTSPDGRIRLINADCLEVLPALGNVDAIITDPPYGVGNFIQITGNLRGEEVTWNDSAPAPELFETLRAISRHRIIWGANYFNCFEPNGGAIVWDKSQTCPNFSRCDIASSSHLRKTEVFRINWNGGAARKDTEHPCERPVLLYVKCIEYLPYSETILDPFAGSCTTAIACIRTDRRCICIEKEPKYWQIGIERCKREYARTVLFNEQEAVA